MRRRGKRPLREVLLGMIGYLLSPLSWWNDAYVNLPLAYLVSLPFLLLGKKAFLLANVVAYWLTNILGLLLLHLSGRSLLQKDGGATPSWRGEVVIAFIVSLAYTLLVVALVWTGILPLPRWQR